MGKKAVKLEEIKDRRNARVTFDKRSSGLLKKAMDLCKLCGAGCKVEIRSPYGGYSYVSNTWKKNVDEVGSMETSCTDTSLVDLSGCSESVGTRSSGSSRRSSTGSSTGSSTTGAGKSLQIITDSDYDIVRARIGGAYHKKADEMAKLVEAAAQRTDSGKQLASKQAKEKRIIAAIFSSKDTPERNEARASIGHEIAMEDAAPPTAAVPSKKRKAGGIAKEQAMVESKSTKKKIRSVLRPQ